EEAANKEIARNLYHVNSLLLAAKTDDAQKKEMLLYHRNVEQTILTGIGNLSIQVEETGIAQEIDELLYYVNQRVSYRFSEVFDRNFVSLAQPKEKQRANAVRLCLWELVQDLEIELAQEIRATSLRVEKFVLESLNLVLRRLTGVILQHEQQFRLQSQFEGQAPGNFELPALNWESQALAQVPALYRNPKDWVEGKGRTKMREAVWTAVHPQISTWLNACGNSLKQQYGVFFMQSANLLKEETGREVVEYYSGLSAALGNAYDISSLEGVRENIERLQGE
ncbi:MAG TPA: hypothetical protein VNU93_01245, partial [Verrucomicrobiae bacterium]|nr:hypothetical protein [Verrucomicrobiae bacterium]